MPVMISASGRFRSQQRLHTARIRSCIAALFAFRLLNPIRQNPKNIRPCSIKLQLITCYNVACGAGCGTVQGETDENGRVLLKDYYPEEMYLILMDHQDKVRWQGNVLVTATSGWITIEIQSKRSM